MADSEKGERNQKGGLKELEKKGWLHIGGIEFGLA